MSKNVNGLADYDAPNNLEPIKIQNLKDFKESIVAYGMHPPYVRQMLNTWATQNRIIPQTLENFPCSWSVCMQMCASSRAPGQRCT